MYNPYIDLQTIAFYNLMNHYDSITIKSPLEFSSIFCRLSRVNSKKVLTQYSRSRLICLAILLNRKYCDKPVSVATMMLSSSDLRFRKIERSISHFLKKKAIPNVEYVVMFETTTLELLRKAFSISIDQFDEADEPKSVDKLQYQTLKLVTQINEDLMRYKIVAGQSDDIARLTYTNCASTFDILHYDKQNEYLYQLTQSILFFKLIEGNDKYASLLSGFYDYYKIDNWRKYVLTVSSVFCLSINGEGVIPGDLHIDEDSLISRPVIESLCIPWKIGQIPYSGRDEFDINGNSDFRIFRDKPLFKMPDGDYAVHSRPLIADRLYSGLYFDFCKVAKIIEEKHPDVPNLFTSEFIEKTLFGGLMKDCINDEHFYALDEGNLKTIYKIKEGELGYPDYVVKSNDAIILFECKDIRINAWIKEKRDYKLLEKELRNKLVSKTYKLDYEKKQLIDIRPKRIGCGQLAGHVSNIRHNMFPWAPESPSDIDVYSVLVVADNRLLADGLTNLLQRWYCECLSNEGIDSANEKPLIVMSPISLLKYSSLFKRYGFTKFFDDYHKTISQSVDSVLDVFNRLISFDDYMSHYPFDLKDKAAELMKELRNDKTE